MTPATRAALYTRDPSGDDPDASDAQLRSLRSYAHRRGFDVTCELVDPDEGPAEDRPVYRKLLEAAHDGDVDIVLAWSPEHREVREPARLFRVLGARLILYHDMH